MIKEREFDRLFRQEFKDLLNNTVWRNDDGTYQVFGRYSIVPEQVGYRVFCAATDVGLFYSTKTAMSWCIADKYQNYNLAQELKDTDLKLQLENQLAKCVSWAKYTQQRGFNNETARTNQGRSNKASR
jgi:hypothetical protein